VCVIQAPKQVEAPATPEIEYPTNNVGGGYPVLADVQGRQHVATIACLVTDGHKTYALTNRHVTGEPGEVVYSRLAGKVVPIGKTASLSLSQKPFRDVYPSFPGEHARINLDAGLIEIENLERWSAKVRMIGVVEPMADISVDNVSLALLGCHVTGHGAAGGLMNGEIQGLFYRYKSTAGFEYVSDLLIGPRAEGHPLRTLPGDSGTLRLIEPLPKRLQPKEPSPRPHCLPIAVQWGPNSLAGSTESAPQAYVLATFLSNVCGPLSLDLVRDWNLDQDDTWGAVGHFAIAGHAPHGLVTENLKELLANNAKIIGHDDATILKSEFKGMGEDDFVPLADVPDFFWKHGKQGASRHFEGPNHFADMDQKRPGDRKTLLDLCKRTRTSTPTFGTNSTTKPKTYSPVKQSRPSAADSYPSGFGRSSTRWSTSPKRKTSRGSYALPARSPTTSATPASPCTSPTCTTATPSALRPAPFTTETAPIGTRPKRSASVCTPHTRTTWSTRTAKKSWRRWPRRPR